MSSSTVLSGLATVRPPTGSPRIPTHAPTRVVRPFATHVARAAPVAARSVPVSARQPHRSAGPASEPSSDEPEGSTTPRRRGPRAGEDAFDALEPTTRRLAELAPPLASTNAIARASDEVPARARVSLEELLPQLVRRIAWAGDRRRGSVQLELGSGRHAGTTITVHAADGRVRVQLEGHGADELRGRIAERLERRGLRVDSVT